jgi:two-component system sensor histidine kinase PilS (NtrC family)
MVKLANLRDYPLSPELTGRVLDYLNGFRLFIALALFIAYLAGVLVQAAPFESSTFAGAVLLVYLGFSVYFIVTARRPGARSNELALQSLLLDVLLITLLLNTFSGVAMLLFFVGAAAGIVLPLRLALLVAALASLGVLSQPAVTLLFVGNVDPDQLITAALFGVTLFVLTVMTHLLANWARGYRLIAERQMLSISRLQQINELVIRRLRSGVVAVDADGEIRMMNESAWFLLGSPPAGQRRLAEIAPELNRALQDWQHDPRLEPQTLALDASQAEVVPKFVSLPAGHEVAVIVFLEDNDVVSQRALEMSALSLAELSTSIAHEIRNPLAAISHAAQLLAEDSAQDDGLDGGFDGSQQRLVKIIRNHARRMNEIIENVLQLSRREKSSHELIHLDDWLHELLEEFNGSSPDLRFGLRGVEEAPDTWVLFDRSQLHQVLWKLMENAVQHMGEEHPDPRLELRLRREPETAYCVVSVEDNGPGIPGDRIGRIFEPFYTTRKAGSGLGLYIARQLCEANGAELAVDSVPDQRTRFRIRMPLSSGPGAGAVELEALGGNA